MSDQPPISGPAACTAAKVRRLARQVTRIYDEALAPFGLTIGQIGLLASLRRSEGLTIAALADRLGNDASTVSRLLKPLVAAGHVALTPDPADARAKQVRLTQAGFERRAAAGAGWQAAQARIAATLGDGRLATLRFVIDDAQAHLADARSPAYTAKGPAA